MKIGRGRRSTQSIMAHGRFGDLKIIKSNGEIEIIPAENLTLEGKRRERSINTMKEGSKYVG